MGDYNGCEALREVDELRVTAALDIRRRRVGLATSPDRLSRRVRQSVLPRCPDRTWEDDTPISDLDCWVPAERNDSHDSTCPCLTCPCLKRSRTSIKTRWAWSFQQSVNVDAYTWAGEPENAAPEEHTELRSFSADEPPESEGMDAYRAMVVKAFG